MTRPTLALAVALFATTAMADVISGHPEVVDGDTIKIEGRSLRLAGIDAPEMKQSRGQWSKYQLIDIIRGREVVCEWDDSGVYGRPLAICAPVLASGRVSRVSINKTMVRAGAAYASPYDDRFERQQSLAMNACVGLWSGDKLPWCYRKGLRE